ncbi:MAG: hypothetical protein EZS28_027987 [Streblomastix strix]|uniref:Uncharacterized protein n=1 Tax=Streblomastix strix TaxID=222440 RepID=A0A5J4V194_9EUKA|nr:MAG: hypothetical protein EZS28_027987 [Streblomastix strix]
MKNDKLKNMKQFLDTPEAKPSQLQIVESFGRSLTLILNQIRQDYNLLYQIQKSKAKKKIKVLPFGITLERDSDRMIDQTQKQTTRIFNLDIILGMTLDRRIRDKEEEEEITGEEIIEKIKIVITDLTERVAPWLPAQSVPTTSLYIVVPDLSQRQIGSPISQLVRTPESWKSNKTPNPKQYSKQPTPTQGTPAASPPPIKPSNVELPPIVDTQFSDMVQPVNIMLPYPPNSWSDITTQPMGADF